MSHIQKGLAASLLLALLCGLLLATDSRAQSDGSTAVSAGSTADGTPGAAPTVYPNTPKKQFAREIGRAHV